MTLYVLSADEMAAVSGAGFEECVGATAIATGAAFGAIGTIASEDVTIGVGFAAIGMMAGTVAGIIGCQADEAEGDDGDGDGDGD